MKICVLSSGSKGNMTYIEGGNTRLLIDAGITLVNAKKRNSEINLDGVTDIIITHEHGDHIGYLDTVQKKTNASIYMSKKTFEGIKPNLRDKLVGVKIGFLEPESRYKIGDLGVITFKLSHDCNEVFGYVITYNNKRVGYFTDTGVMPDKYLKHLSNLDVLILEANHNIEMLLNSKREMHLIQRILSTQGHISNNKCYEILSKVLTDKNKYVILAHVSEDCNSDQCLHNDIINKLYNYKGEIIIAKQFEACKVINLD
ncbi:MAG: MBL fold metallo-hydrolase [Bacilli bacterium]|nr:MBL fold metallo-hydrolase [Bacilli bacterium]